MRKEARYGLGLLILAVLLGAFLFLPIDQWALLLVGWIRDAGALGVAVYAAAYVMATLLLLPGSILTAGAGFAYGPLWGTLLVSPVSVLAATLAFTLGRSVLRTWVSRRVDEHPRFAAVDQAIGESGFKIVFLLRLSPIFPFNLLNYALGLTRVRLRDYVVASLFGMLPGTILYVYLGSLVTSASELLSGKPSAAGGGSQVLYWGGLAATLLVTVIITRVARKALGRALNGTELAGPLTPIPRYACPEPRRRAAQSARLLGMIGLTASRQDPQDRSSRVGPVFSGAPSTLLRTGVSRDAGGHPAPPLILPDDEHNRALVENVHPPAWVNPAPSGRYNLVVLGAGTAGLVSAAGAAGLGAKVAIVEKHLMGGDCLNFGCVPSKGVLRAARAAVDAREAAAFGVRVDGSVHVDFAAVMERMRRLRAGISRNDSAARLAKLGVDVYLGEARFVAPDAVEVGGVRLQFRRAVVATGARAASLPIPGLAEAGYLTNETVFSLTALPRRLAVIGAGPVGCELAQAFARFGSEVTLIEAMPQILIEEDRDAARIVQRALEREGVKIVVGCKIANVGCKMSVEGRPEGKTIVAEHGGTRREVTVDEILVGVGRAPNVEGLGLEAAGVEFDRTGVKVDVRLRTTNRRIYAAGDVCSAFKFTHAADAMARIVLQNALFFGRKKASALVIPWCTYTDPEIAHVGLYEKEARERGRDVATLTVELGDIDRAILDGETEGFARVHYEKRSGHILGATLVARHAGDMIGELSLAVTNGLSLGSLAKTIHPYPTQAEAWKRVADAYQRSRLTPGVRSAFERYLRWRR